jgi:hypothetical protein
MVTYISPMRCLLKHSKVKAISSIFIFNYKCGRCIKQLPPSIFCIGKLNFRKYVVTYISSLSIQLNHFPPKYWFSSLITVGLKFWNYMYMYNKYTLFETIFKIFKFDPFYSHYSKINIVIPHVGNSIVNTQS